MHRLRRPTQSSGLGARLGEVCEIDGCERLPVGRFCGMHAARARRGAPMHAPVQERRSPRGWLRESALRYQAAESDEDYAAADALLDKAATKHVATKLRRVRSEQLSAVALARWQSASDAQRAAVGRMLANARAKAAEKTVHTLKTMCAAHAGAGADKRPAESVAGARDARCNAEDKNQLQAGASTRKAFSEGHIGQSGRRPGDGEAHPRAGAVARTGCAQEAREPRGQRRRADRSACSGGGAGSGGPAPVQPRARKGRGDR